MQPVNQEDFKALEKRIATLEKSLPNLTKQIQENNSILEELLNQVRLYHKDLNKVKTKKIRSEE